MKHPTSLIGVSLLVTLMLAGHAAAQDCVEPPAGLVSWWPGDGDATDLVGRSRSMCRGPRLVSATKPGKVAAEGLVTPPIHATL